MSQNNQEWLPPQRSQVSNRDRIDDLVRSHRPLLNRLARTYFTSKEDQEDLESNAVLAVCRRFASYNPEKGTFSTWLGAVIRNEAIDMRQKLARQPKTLPNDENSEAFLDSVASKFEPESTMMEQAQLATKIPKVYLNAFRLVTIQGKSSTAAGEELGASSGTIRTYVWRARKALKSALQTSLN